MTWETLGIDVAGKTSGQIATTCPRCSHERRKAHVKCLSVNLDKGVWLCHHCEWSGSLSHGEDTRYPRQKRYRIPVPLSTRPLGTSALSWLQSRAIPAHIAERRQIRTEQVYMPQVEDYVTALAFPYFRYGVHVNTKYRTRDKLFRMASGCELLFYGLDDITGDTLVICEGELDALSCEVAGVSSVVSVPNGAPALNTREYSKHFDYLTSATELLAPIRRVIIAVDNDAPGQKLAEELARRLGQERCWRVHWPTDCDHTPVCKDANDVLRYHGAERLRHCLTDVEPWPISGVIRVRQLRQAIEVLYEHGVAPGLSPGWASLAMYYTVRGGELTVITGVPSHGKTRFLSNMIVNMARLHDWRFAIFSPESAPMERYARLMLEQHTGQPFHGPQRLDEFTLWDAEAWLDDHVCFLMPVDAKPTVSHLLDLARTQVSRMGIKGLVLDPYNWLEHQRSPGVTETEYVSMILTELCLFAARYDVHVWLVAHPTKLRKEKSGAYAGKYAPATLYDISGSAHFFNKAHNGLSIWRDSESGSRITEVHILKVRWEEIGSQGMVELRYDPGTKTYHDLSEPL